MTKHTPEPWKFFMDDPTSGINVPLETPWKEGEFVDDPEATENAKRILSCINACVALTNPGEDIKRLEDYKFAALALFGSFKVSRTILGGSLGLIILSTVVDLIFSEFFGHLQPLIRHLPAFIVFMTGVSWMFFLYRYMGKEYKRVKKVYLGEE